MTTKNIRYWGRHGFHHKVEEHANSQEALRDWLVFIMLQVKNFEKNCFCLFFPGEKHDKVFINEVSLQANGGNAENKEFGPSVNELALLGFGFFFATNTHIFAENNPLVQQWDTPTGRPSSISISVTVDLKTTSVEIQSRIFNRCRSSFSKKKKKSRFIPSCFQKWRIFKKFHLASLKNVFVNRQLKTTT